MPDYRRVRVVGGCYFFTLVTYHRRPIFRLSAARELLGTVMRDCRRRYPFETTAVVLLPDHLHLIWTLPRGDDRYSARLGWIKKEFSKRWSASGRLASTVTPGEHRERRAGVWQKRFWEHTIETDDDFERHFDYIHFNPVKHGHARRPHEWPWSSFDRWVRKGVYPREWACGEDRNFDDIADSTGE